MLIQEWFLFDIITWEVGSYSTKVLIRVWALIQGNMIFMRPRYALSERHKGSKSHPRAISSAEQLAGNFLSCHSNHRLISLAACFNISPLELA